jgi:hypothetical protein
MQGRRPRGLEQKLVSALAHAESWSLTAEEKRLVEDGCLIDACRGIGEKKTWLSLLKY